MGIVYNYCPECGKSNLTPDPDNRRENRICKDCGHVDLLKNFFHDKPYEEVSENDTTI